MQRIPSGAKSRKFCSVPQCNSYRVGNVSLHRFPLTNEKLCNAWKEALQIGKPISKNMYVCSLHFVPNDYINITSSTKRPHLKKGAVPSQKLPSSFEEQEASCSFSKTSCRDFPLAASHIKQEYDEEEVDPLSNLEDDINIKEEFLEDIAIKEEIREVIVIKKESENVSEVNIKEEFIENTSTQEEPEAEFATVNIKEEHNDSFNGDLNVELEDTEKSSNDENNKKCICKICQKKFDKPSQLQNHHNRKHCDPEKWDWQCSTCGKKFPVKENLLHHERFHQNPEEFQCDKCRATFQHRKSLKRHKAQCQKKEKTSGINDYCRRIGKKPPFVCDKCDKVFMYKKHLRRHKVMHEPKIYPCEICNKKFSLLSFLQKHQSRIHCDPEKWDYQCHICEEKFPIHEYLTRHLLIHKDPEQLKCDICSKTFKMKRLLKEHKVRMHSKDTEYVCKKCAKTFNSPSELNEHLEFHRKVNTCPICSKQYLHGLSLKYHLQSHEEQVLHKCEHCSKTYKSKAGLLCHIGKFHSSKATETQQS